MENSNPQGEVKTEKVPHIIVEDISSLDDLDNTSVRSRAKKIEFPLSDEDKKDLAMLAKRYEHTKGITGLSAPQIGINKRAFVFAINDRGGKEQKFRQNIWINPIYRNATGATLDEGYEACRSLKSQKSHVVGPVFRFNRIFYRAYDTEGRILEGEARDYAARVIQHEVDHLDGKLFVDYVQPERVLLTPDYCERLKAGTLDKLQIGIVPQHS